MKLHLENFAYILSGSKKTSNLFLHHISSSAPHPHPELVCPLSDLWFQCKVTSVIRPIKINDYWSLPMMSSSNSARIKCFYSCSVWSFPYIWKKIDKTNRKSFELLKEGIEKRILLGETHTDIDRTHSFLRSLLSNKYMPSWVAVPVVTGP